MIDPAEKSTEVPSHAVEAGNCEVAPGVLLDSRLGIFHRQERWLAVSDLHFGYEVSRRRDGGLWPLWGMETIEARLRAMVEEWAPEQLILVGDIVDSSAAPEEAITWLASLSDLCPEVILIEGNHDRGEVKRHFEFVPWYRKGEFFFHHGHRDRLDAGAGESAVGIEVTGHFHPSVRFNDGAGTSLKLPALTREVFVKEGRELWRLPAFSPWAGGHPAKPTGSESTFSQWACGGKRIFEVVEK